jgi:hypothetical protein
MIGVWRNHSTTQNKVDVNVSTWVFSGVQDIHYKPFGEDLVNVRLLPFKCSFAEHNYCLIEKFAKTLV